MVALLLDVGGNGQLSSKMEQDKLPIHMAARFNKDPEVIALVRHRLPSSFNEPSSVAALRVLTSNTIIVC